MSVVDFARRVLHGDSEHRAWLLEAAHAYSYGDPIPEPRGGSEKDQRIVELERQLAEARAALVRAETQFGIIADEAEEERIQDKALRFRDRARAALAQTGEGGR